MARHKIFLVPTIFLILTLEIVHGQWRPCVELSRQLNLPCNCAISTRQQRAVDVNCDNIYLSSDLLEILHGQPIASFSQRNSGHQSLSSDLLASLSPNLERLDLSENRIHRLMDRQLQGFTKLRELKLANNALGDNLNPIFSSNEFHEVSALRMLDLKDNGIKSIEEGIFKGCTSLEELYLDNNNLTMTPIESLKGPKGLKILSLSGNSIRTVHRAAFSVFGDSMQKLDLSRNELSHLDDGAFVGMKILLVLNISNNDLHRFNSDVFKGAQDLLQLDISMNFLTDFPSDALRHLEGLKFLNLSNNLITELDRHHLTGLNELQVFDLSRNDIRRLGVNTFSALKSLVRLDLGFNSLRAIDESSFEGLNNLKWLSLQDNNILLVPSSALARLPSLVHLHLEFNRVAALSGEFLRASAPRLVTISLTRNLVRELPPRVFYNFKRLLSIELSGNMITSINDQTFVSLEDTLLHLDLSSNRLTSVAEIVLKSLLSLNLASNQLRQISANTFKHLDRLQYLNISDNPLHKGFPPQFPDSLISLDISRTGLKILPTTLLLNLASIESVLLSGNRLKELTHGSFAHLVNLTTIDLSYNDIERIDKGAFVGLKNLHKINLRGNRLTIFGGEHFDTGTGLEKLDLSHNLLTSLSPTTFLIHPRLREVDLSSNRFSGFPSDYAKGLQFLERLDLSSNRLIRVGEFAFAQIGRLKSLDLSYNSIESVDELAFYNSTQLQHLDLSYNQLESLSERMMEGVSRLENLILRNNKLSSLPETLFDQSKLYVLERIDLSGNRFAEIPTRSLQKQSNNLVELNVARNRLVEIYNQGIINTVKDLDLSENPLSENAIQSILGEAKVLRSLSLASCGIKSMLKLEAPFLKNLNLSNNSIRGLGVSVLERSTMLENLDLSRNHLRDFFGIFNAFGSLGSLKSLDASRNDILQINESSFQGFESLRRLRIARLANCTRIEKNAFKNLSKLQDLVAYDYPRLGYFDVQGILKNMHQLEAIDVEIKDVSVGNEQLSLRTHPRLKKVVLRGDRLKNVLSSALAGVRSSTLYIGIKNTSVDQIPANLFFSVPRSTQMILDVSGSKFKTISPQFTSALEERGGAVRLKGLNISLRCDCEAKQLWRWARSPVAQTDEPIICSSPAKLKGRFLHELVEDQLSCDSEKVTTVTQATSDTTVRMRRPTTSEPDIIWTVAPKVQDGRRKSPNDLPSSINIGLPTGTDDTLIIGIVLGVIGFIAIVVIFICICRLHKGSSLSDAQMQATMASSVHEASMIRPMGAYAGKLNPELYLGTYNGSTLGHHLSNGNNSLSGTPVQMMPFVHQPMSMLHAVHQQSGPQAIYGCYDNSPVSMYVTCASENKFER